MSGPAAHSLGGGAPELGEIIAQKYRVEGLVGRGGMGVVVSARHVQLGQAVAIKLLTLPPDEDRRDEAIGRFLHEAKAAARLQNDHVVRIHDVGQLDNGLPFTLSMGCGTWQGNSISENLNWRCFVNITHLVTTIPEDKPSEEALFGAYWAKYGK